MNSSPDPVSALRHPPAFIAVLMALLLVAASVAVATGLRTTDAQEPETGTIIIIKQTQGGTGTFNFTATADDQSVIDFTVETTPIPNYPSWGFGYDRQDDVPAGHYVISENEQTGWSLEFGWCRDETGARYDLVDSDQDGDLDSADVTLNAGGRIICWLTNVPEQVSPTGNLTIVKDAVGGDSTFHFDVTGPEAFDDDVDIDTAADDDDSESLAGLTPGQYTITEVLTEEQIAAGWSFTALACTVDDAPVDDLDDSDTDASVTVDLMAGQTVICTFTNELEKGNVTIIKASEDAGPEDVFGFTVDDVAVDPIAAGGQFALEDLDPGVDVTVNETLTEEQLAAGWELTSITCTVNETEIDLTGRLILVDDVLVGVDIDVLPGQNIVCTFTNERQVGTLTIVKHAIGGDSTFDFTVTGPNGYTNNPSIDTGEDDDDSVTLADLVAGQYTIVETLTQEQIDAGWSLTDISCTVNGDPVTDPTPGDGTMVVDLNADDTIVCTFTNELVTGNLTIVKHAIGGESSFHFDVTGPQTFDADVDIDTAADDDDSETLTDLLAGTYTIVEDLTDEQEAAGWVLTGIACTVDDAPVTVVEHHDTTDPDNPLIGVDVDVLPGQTVVCTFTNEQNLGRIIIEKQTEPDGDTTSFDFTADYNPEGFSLADDETNDSGETLVAGTYNVAETVPEGWDLTSIVCVDEETNDPVDAVVTDNSVAIPVAPGQTVHCTFTNEMQAGHIIIEKLAEDGDDVGFDFSIDDSTDLITVMGNSESDPQDVAGNMEHTVTEHLPAGWTLSDIDDNPVCFLLPADIFARVAPQQVGTAVDASITVYVPAGRTVLCKFVDEKDTGTVTIVKDFADDFTGDETFDFTVDGTPQGPLGVATPEFTLTDLDPDEDLTVLEVLTAEQIAAGWSLDSISCTVDGTPVDFELHHDTTVEGEPLIGVEIDVMAGQTVVCTFINSQTVVSPTGNLTIVKDAVGGDSTFHFDVTGPEAFDDDVDIDTAADDDDSETLAGLTAGTYTVLEDLTDEQEAAGWTLTGVACTVDDAPVTVVEHHDTTAEGSPLIGVDVEVAAGQTVVCTFTNALETGHIIIEKLAVGGDDVGFEFWIDDTMGPIIVNGNDISDPQEVAGNMNHTVTENMPEGWQLTDVVCFLLPEDIFARVAPEEVGTQVDNSVEVFVPAGRTVICKFVDEERETDQQVTIIKQALDGEGEAPSFTFDFTGSTTASLVIDTEAQNGIFVGTGTQAVATGSLTITEQDTEGWDFSVGFCLDEEGNRWDFVDGTVTIDVTENDDIICFVTNVPEQVGSTGNLQIVKEATGGDSTFGFTVSGPNGYMNSPSIDTGADDDDSVALAGLEPGQYTITEVLTEEQIAAGWSLTALACTVDDAPVDDLDDSDTDASVTVDLMAGQTVICTFANTLEVQAPTLTVCKVLEDNGADPMRTGATFNFDVRVQGEQPFDTVSLAVDEGGDPMCDTADLSGVDPGATIEVVEWMSRPDDWAGDAEGYPQYAVNDGERTSNNTVTLGAITGDTTVTFYNKEAVEQQEQPGNIVVVKNTTGGDDIFAFNTDDDPESDLSITTTGGTGMDDTSLANLANGTSVTISELLSTPQTEAGWRLTDVACVVTDEGQTPGEQSTITETDNVPTVVIADGETVTCTFTNLKQQPQDIFGRIIVDKVTDPSGVDTEFDFSGDLGEFTLTDAADPFDTGLTLDPANSPFTITEAAEEGWDLDSIACVYEGTTDPANAVVTDNSVDVTVAAGDTVVCTFTNVQQGEIIVPKTVLFADETSRPAMEGEFTFDLRTGASAGVAGTTIATASTDASGNVTFSGVVAGDYQLCEVGVDEGTSVVFSEGGMAFEAEAGTLCVNITVAAGQSLTVSVSNAPAAEGCTPGYWRQEQHFDSWTATGYSPSDSFQDVFGVSDVTVGAGGQNTIDDPTLLEAVWATGGGESALARHAVAALLNASLDNETVNYAYTTDEVIAIVQDAYATGDFETAANLLAEANEAGCPLN